MKKNYVFRHTIDFLGKGIIVSLLTLLSVAVHSNPIDKNTARKTGCDFPEKKPPTPLPDAERGFYSYAENTSSGTAIISADKTPEASLPPLTPDSYEGDNGNNTWETAYAIPASLVNNVSTVSISPANCHLATDVDYYKINLSSLSSLSTYTVLTTLFDSSNPDGNSIYTLKATISYSTNGYNWISAAANRQLPAMTLSGGTLYLKIEPSSEAAEKTGTYAAGIVIRKTGTTGCTYTFSPVNAKVTSEAGIAQIINVVSSGSCSWTAISNVAWITITSQASSGVGTVAYSYAANTQWSSRTGTITIAGQDYILTQLPPPLTRDNREENDTPEQAGLLTPSFENNAAALSIAEVNCHRVEDVDIYKIDLEVNYQYTISGTLYDKDNQTSNSSYTLNAKARWSTDGSQWNEWGDAQLSSRPFQGGRTLYIKVSPEFPGGVGTYAATINISRTPGCTYVFSPANMVTRSAAGAEEITVTPSSSCTSPWNAVTTADWIAITSDNTATTGSQVVRYSYAANTQWYSRTATIDIAGQGYTVTQLPSTLGPDGYEGEHGNNTPGQAYPFTPVFAQNASTVSVSPANFHNTADVDYYKINLSNDYSYSFSGVLNGNDNQIDDNNYTLHADCDYSTDGSRWIYAGDEKLSGRAVTGGILYLRIRPHPEGHVGNYEAKIDIKIETVVACIYALPVSRVEVTAEEGIDKLAAVTVTEGQSCTWAAGSNADWITLTSVPSGTGSGNVVYSYLANRAPAPRTGTITIAGLTYTVIQAGRPLAADSYEENDTAGQASGLTPSYTQHASTISVFANCHNAQDVDFYKVILEAGFTYKVSAELGHANHQIGYSNYTLGAKISHSTDASAWTDWEGSQLTNLTVQGGTQGGIYFKIQPGAANATGTYAVKIEIKKVSTIDCTYELQASSRGVTWEAGSDQVGVQSGSSSGSSSCLWGVDSNVSWLRITSGINGTGRNGQVAYSYEANNSLSPRTGIITIADKTFTVTQGAHPDKYEVNNTVAQARSLTPVFTKETSTLSIGTANCHNATDVDYYKIILDDGFSYSVSGILYEYNTPNTKISYTLDAQISYSMDGSHWSSPEGNQLPTTTVPGGNLYLKIEPAIEPAVRRSTGTYAAEIKIKKAATLSCTYALSAPIPKVASDKGTGRVSVTTGVSCFWTASSNAGWITITSELRNTGSGTVVYSYSANTEWASRTGTITIAGRTYTVTQLPHTLAGDDYEVNNTVERASLLSLPATFNTENTGTVSISANCHEVEDVDIYRISLENGYRYTFSSSLYDKKTPSRDNYSLDAQSYFSTDGSHWNLWVSLPSQYVQGGNKNFYFKIIPSMKGLVGTYRAEITVNRAASCAYSFVPESKEAASTAGTDQITVTGSALCTAAINPSIFGSSWISITSRSGQPGSEIINYSYSANTEWASRTGTITIGGQNYTVTQLPPTLQPDSYEMTTGNNTLEQAYSFNPVFNQNASTLSISPANCHDIADVDFYKINLENGYFYSLSLQLSDKINAPANHTLDAKVYYSTDGSDWSDGTEDNFSIGAVQGGILYVKIEPKNSGKVGTYSARININIISGCSTFTLSAASREVPATAGNDGQIDVTAGALCYWTANTNATSWVTLTSGHDGKNGPGRVNYTYRENVVTEPRTAAITVAGQTYTLTQTAAPACTFTLDPDAAANVPAEAGRGSLSVKPLRSNCTWSSPVSNVDWISITSGQNGATGEGRVGYSYTANLTDNSRTGTLTVAGKTFTLTQSPPPCTVTPLASNPANVTDAAGTGTISVTPRRNNCPWTATSNAAWIALTPGYSGTTGPGSVRYSYTKNETSASRTGSITVADQTYTVIQATAAPCNFTLASYTKRATAEAGTETVSVIAPANACSWTAFSNASWITLTSGHNGTTGSGPLGFSYTKNKTSALRTGSITVAGLTYTLTQATASPCNFTLASYTKTATAEAGTETVSVIAPADTCSWTAFSNASWITLTSGHNGTTGSGPLGFSYTKNETSALRTGSITVAGLTYTVTQATASACTFTLASYTKTATAEAGTETVSVIAPAVTCSWTAFSNASWITLTSGHNGSTGSGPLGFSYTKNETSALRTGSITVAGLTYTVTQATASACTFTLASYTKTATAEAGTETVSVIAPAVTCSWTAFSNASWITLTSGHNGSTGSGPLGFSYTKNETSALRTGSITVAGLTYTVTQAAASACTFTLDPKEQKVLPAAAGSGSVAVSTAANCTWKATSNAAWITVTSGQTEATGSGTMRYSYTKNETSALRTGSITVAGLTYTLTQETACTFTLDPKEQKVPAAAGLGSVAVTTAANCTWTASSNADWIALTSGHNGTTGSGTLGFSYTKNETSALRTGSITVAGLTYTVTQATASACTFTLASYTKTATAEAGTETVSVIAPAVTCSWTAFSNASWITLTSGHNGTTGSGTLYFSYQKNTGTAARTGIITVAGETYTLIQGPASCSFTLASNTGRPPAAAGSGSVAVSTADNCTWKATSNAAWITVTSGQTETTGSGTMRYSYTENKTTDSRTGTITVAGLTYTVTQAAPCTFTLDSKEQKATAAAGSGSIAVTTAANCTWTASSDADWITLTSKEGTGPGKVEYSYTKNETTVSRTGNIKIADQTYTITQTAEASAISCNFTLAPNTDAVTAAAGKGSISFNIPGRCPWKATSGVDWITLTSSSEGTGSGKVDYSYTANTTAASRTGTIKIADQTFTLNQSPVTAIEPDAYVRIFPNPAGDFVTVDLSAGFEKCESLKIVNPFGQTLYELKTPLQNFQIPLKEFANGMYFILLQGEEKVWVKKLLIAH